MLELVVSSAFMSTGPRGEEFTFDERLAEIASRFGEGADAYKKCVIEVKKLKNDKRYVKIK